jgi:hypothetical protein
VGLLFKYHLPLYNIHASIGRKGRPLFLDIKL